MKDVDSILINLGITPNLTGFEYIKMALRIISGSKTNHVKKICACVAEKFEVSEAAVERAIRYAISNVDKSKWEALGGNGLKNNEFLYTLMYIVKKGANENAK